MNIYIRQIFINLKNIIIHHLYCFYIIFSFLSQGFQRPGPRDDVKRNLNNFPLIINNYN